MKRLLLAAVLAAAMSAQADTFRDWELNQHGMVVTNDQNSRYSRYLGLDPCSNDVVIVFPAGPNDVAMLEARLQSGSGFVYKARVDHGAVYEVPITTTSPRVDGHAAIELDLPDALIRDMIHGNVLRLKYSETVYGSFSLRGLSAALSAAECTPPDAEYFDQPTSPRAPMKRGDADFFS